MPLHVQARCLGALRLTSSAIFLRGFQSPNRTPIHKNRETQHRPFWTVPLRISKPRRKKTHKEYKRGATKKTSLGGQQKIDQVIPAYRVAPKGPGIGRSHEHFIHRFQGEATPKSEAERDATQPTVHLPRVTMARRTSRTIKSLKVHTLLN